MPSVGAAVQSVDAARNNRDSRWMMREHAQRLCRPDPVEGKRYLHKIDKRLHGCGRKLAHGEDFVRVMMNGTGVASFAGVQTCGSVWLCSMCSAAIRVGRQDEVQRATDEHVRRGGGLEFVTLTERHYLGDRLSMLFDGAADGWRDVLRDHDVRGWREVLAWDFVRALEITWTWDNGWHAHLHVVLFTGHVWDDDERAQVRAGIEAAWIDSVHLRTGRRPSLDVAVNWKGGASAADVASYLTKPQEAQWGLGAELTRADVKGNKGGRSVYPLDLPLIAAGVLVDGSLTHVEEVRRMAYAVKLWHEYADSTHRRRMLTWSRGLKARLLGDEPELTDEELAEAEQAREKVEVGRLCRTEKYAVWRCDLAHTMLVATEENGVHGFDTIRRIALTRAHAAGWLDESERQLHALLEGLAA